METDQTELLHGHVGAVVRTLSRAVARRFFAAMRGVSPTCRSEEVLLLLSFAAWIGLAAAAPREDFSLFCATGSWSGRFGATFEAASMTGAIQEWCLHWMTMVVAMMFPLLMQPVRHVSGRSYRRRRGRSVSAFLVGYGAVWMATGAALATMGIGLQVSGMVPGPGQTGLLLVSAVAWQFSGWKAMALRRCHMTCAIAAVGVRADWSCARYGISHGLACVSACWAIMVGVMSVGPDLVFPLALAITALLFIERANPAPRAPSQAAMLASAAARIVLPR